MSNVLNESLALDVSSSKAWHPSELQEDNPYPVTNPKHNEFRRAVRAATVDRVGFSAAKNMRLSDFLSEEFRHDVVVLRREKAREVKLQHGALPPPLPPLEDGTVVSQLPVPVNGFADPPASIPSHHASLTGAAGIIRIVSATTVHGGQRVWLGLSDGRIAVVPRHAATSEGLSSLLAKKESSSCGTLVDIARQFLDSTHCDELSLLEAKADNVVGTELGCKEGSWVSKRMHRSVRHRINDQAVVREAVVVAECMLSIEERFVAVAASSGSVQVWDSVADEGLVVASPVPEGAAGSRPEAAAAALRMFRVASARTQPQQPRELAFAVWYEDGRVSVFSFVPELLRTESVDAAAPATSPAPTREALSLIVTKKLHLKGGARGCPAAAVSGDGSTLFFADTGGCVHVADYSKGTLHVHSRLSVLQLLDDFRQSKGQVEDGAASSAANRHCITCMDARGDLVVLGLASGDVILLQSRAALMSQRVAKVLAVHKFTDSAVTAVTISKATAEVWTVCGNALLVAWSLEKHLAYAVTQRTELVSAAAYNSAAVENSSTQPVEGHRRVVDLSVQLHLDAHELWTTAANGVNYIWMAEFSHTNNTLEEVKLLCDSRIDADASLLEEWDSSVQRKNAEATEALIDSVNFLEATNNAETFRRYYWTWKHFRLRHQLKTKQPTIAEAMRRFEFERMAREYFNVWMLFRNQQRRRKRQQHAAATLALMKSRQAVQGALILWERFSVLRRMQRRATVCGHVLLQSTQRLHVESRWITWMHFVDRCRQKRRWSTIAASMSGVVQLSLVRRMYTRWRLGCLKRTETVEWKQKAARVAQRSSQLLCALYLTKWYSFRALQQRRQLLKKWSDVLDSSDRSRLSACLSVWTSFVHRRKCAKVDTNIAIATQTLQTLTVSVSAMSSRLEKLQRLHRLQQQTTDATLAAAKAADLQRAIEDRVAVLKYTQSLKRDSTSDLQQQSHEADRLAESGSGQRSEPEVEATADEVASAAGAMALPRMASSLTRTMRDSVAIAALAMTHHSSRQQLAQRSFPVVMQRLKGKWLNFATDVPLLVQAVERSRCAVGSGVKAFHVTCGAIERMVRNLFTTAVALEGQPKQSLSASPVQYETGAVIDGWVPEGATESAVRDAVLTCVDSDIHSASALLSHLKTLVCSYDCLTPQEKQHDISEKLQAAFVLHEELLLVVYDALVRAGVTL